MIPASPPAEVPWSDFLGSFHWRQGEHLTLIGPTGCGKTTLAKLLLTAGDRKRVAVFSTKPEDPVIDDFGGEGFRRIPSWVVSDHELMPRVVLAPAINGFDSIPLQREVFRGAMDSAFRQGGWCLYWDETRYLTDFLQLGREAQMLWQMGRSAGITVVAAAQRPRHLPLVAYDQATHLFFWRTADDQMLRRLGELAGAADPASIRMGISSLDFHSMIYVNTITGETARTVIPEDLAG